MAEPAVIKPTSPKSPDASQLGYPCSARDQCAGPSLSQTTQSPASPDRADPHRPSDGVPGRSRQPAECAVPEGLGSSPPGPAPRPARGPGLRKPFKLVWGADEGILIPSSESRPRTLVRCLGHGGRGPGLIASDSDWCRVAAGLRLKNWGEIRGQGDGIRCVAPGPPPRLETGPKIAPHRDSKPQRFSVVDADAISYHGQRSSATAAAAAPARDSMRTAGGTGRRTRNEIRTGECCPRLGGAASVRRPARTHDTDARHSAETDNIIGRAAGFRPDRVRSNRAAQTP